MFKADKLLPKQLLLVILLMPFSYVSGCDNCTDDSVTKEELYTEGRSRSTLAWLVTPALFFVGVVYVVYKCCKDGLCNCRRLRQRAAQEHQQEHGYIPLSEVAVYASAMPEGAENGGHRQLVLVHNQTVCVTFNNPAQRPVQGVAQSRPPTYEESLLHNTGQTPSVEVVTNPPSYISSKPPRYSVAMGEASPRPSISEDTTSSTGVILISERPLQLKFISNRRRHRSAQDTRTKHDRQRHFSAQDRRKPLLSDGGDTELDDTLRQRCFSFNALKDAFSRRSQQNVPECQSLLANEDNEEGGSCVGGADSVFSSCEAVSSPGPSCISLPVAAAATTTATLMNHSNPASAISSRTSRRPPQQVSFEDRILEESNENLDLTQIIMDLTVPTQPQARLRQRHFSEPDRSQTQNYKSRHFSGNT